MVSRDCRFRFITSSRTLASGDVHRTMHARRLFPHLVLLHVISTNFHTIGTRNQPSGHLKEAPLLSGPALTCSTDQPHKPSISPLHRTNDCTACISLFATSMKALLIAFACLLAAPTVKATSPASSQLSSGTFAVFNTPSYMSGRAPSSSLLEEVLSPHGNGDICRPTGQIEDACCDYETVEKTLNTPRFYRTLVDLVKTNYFRYYKVNLFKECPFWVENGLCMNRACSVEKASEHEVPEEYRSSSLSSVSTADASEIVFPDDSQETAATSRKGQAMALADSVQCRDSDFCHWEQEETSSESVWVDLTKNPERFTGYAGTSANRVWKAIYEENCFGAVPKGSFIKPMRSKASGGTGFVDHSDLLGSSGPGQSSFNGLSSLMSSLTASADPASIEQCLEKRVFYRVISGLHASISMHVCREYLNQTTGEWSPNLECFISRIARHPERLQNVYFNYVLLVRALARAGDYLTNFNLKPGHSIPESETHTISLLKSLVNQANSCPPTFDEARMFKKSNPEALKLKAEFRNHFRNVSSIMDCVGCDKCRLWGKMQTNGLGTAMKILFSFDESDFDPAKNPALLERSELVALINTLHRFAESLKAVETFRELYQKEVASRREEFGLKPSPSSPSKGTKDEDDVSASRSSKVQTAERDTKAAPPPVGNDSFASRIRGDKSLAGSGSEDFSWGGAISAKLHRAARACSDSVSLCLAWVGQALSEWTGGRFGSRADLREL